MFTNLDGMDPEQYQNSLGDDEEEEDDDVDESSFVQGITDSGHDHDHHAQSTTTPSFGFGRTQSLIDPALDTSPPDNHGDSHSPQHHHNHHHQQQQHLQNQFVNPQIPREIYTDLARSANQFSLQHTTPDQLSAGGARFASSSPAPPKILPAFTPTDRSLPDQSVTDETLDDAYVAFILYCNPSVPLNCDTMELRKAFRQPPKSDGKTFNVHHLLQLIEKFEGREIKTWTRLATELGVERTADQSAQKVQQYAVRLKRWMHAMHIDAFFEYVLNKPHAYYQQIPHLTSSPSSDRDGVPIEEDLALRALHPETRPKRGRRKTDDKDDGSDKDMPDPKRPHFDTPTPSTADPTSAMENFGNSLFTPHPQSTVSSGGGADGMDRLFEDTDPWTAATQSVLSGGGSSGASTGGQQFRWRPFSGEGTTPVTTQPPITVLTSHDGSNTPVDEVPTPTTPSASKPRARRRHGPAVSSAWPSSGNPLTGKLRGRPPSNRSVRDGPFSTFPANPTGKGHTIDLSPGGVGITSTPTPTPVASHALPHQYTFRPPHLHLTVPTRTGGHISVASPASAVTPHPHINGNGSWKREKSPLGRGNGITYSSATEIVDDIERKFSVALLQAQSDGVGLLGVEDAKKIAGRVVANLRQSWPESGDGREADDRAIATLMGCNDNNEGACRDVRLAKLSGGERRTDLDDLGLGGDVDDDLNDDGGSNRYEVRWSVQFGPVKADFSQIVTLPGSGGFHRMSSGLSTLGEEDDDGGLKDLDGLEGFDDGDGTADELRKKIAELERKVKERDREITGIKEKVLKAVVS